MIPAFRDGDIEVGPRRQPGTDSVGSTPGEITVHPAPVAAAHGLSRLVTHSPPPCNASSTRAPVPASTVKTSGGSSTTGVWSTILVSRSPRHGSRSGSSSRRDDHHSPSFTPASRTSSAALGDPSRASRHARKSVILHRWPSSPNRGLSASSTSSACVKSPIRYRANASFSNARNEPGIPALSRRLSSLADSAPQDHPNRASQNPGSERHVSPGRGCTFWSGCASRECRIPDGSEVVSRLSICAQTRRLRAAITRVWALGRQGVGSLGTRYHVPLAPTAVSASGSRSESCCVRPTVYQRCPTRSSIAVSVT